MDTIQPWLALQTRPRSEKKIDSLLRQKGYECFTPTYRQRRKWSDRIVEVDLPLFPMYVFCRLSSSALDKAISTSGVVQIVRFNGKFAEVDVEEIKALQLLMQSNLLREPWKYLYTGTLVQVETGPLAGVQGIISAEGDDKKRLVISVTLLQRSVAIQLDEDVVLSGVARQHEFNAAQSAESKIAAKLLKRT